MRECDQRKGDEHKPHEGDEQKPHDGDEQKPHNSDKQKQLQTVQAAQQMYWAQLHEAQQKVQEADTERMVMMVMLVVRVGHGGDAGAADTER